jgi:serine/threonine protein kinase
MHYIWQIGGAVGHLHSQQTCHNDIKLENILICTRDTAKLADFGFASRTTEKLIERWERRALNIYSAPEIV